VVTQPGQGPISEMTQVRARVTMEGKYDYETVHKLSNGAISKQ